MLRCVPRSTRYSRRVISDQSMPSRNGSQVVPPEAHQLAAEARESEAFTAEAVLIAAEGLSHDTRMKLHSDLALFYDAQLDLKAMD
jgi:hypothetical protein